jgi:hypothetical protein
VIQAKRILADKELQIEAHPRNLGGYVLSPAGRRRAACIGSRYCGVAAVGLPLDGQDRSTYGHQPLQSGRSQGLAEQLRQLGCIVVGLSPRGHAQSVIILLPSVDQSYKKYPHPLTTCDRLSRAYIPSTLEP